MKKFVSLLLALMMALSLVACGSKADTMTDDKTDDDTVTEPANALEKIKADGVLTVALSPDFSPHGVRGLLQNRSGPVCGL